MIDSKTVTVLAIISLALSSIVLSTIIGEKKVTREVVTIKDVTFTTDKQRIQLFIDELLTKKSARCLKAIFQVESHTNPKAKNPRSSAKGVGQLLRGTYKNIGLKHSDDGLAQTVAAIAYVARRYDGNYCKALAHHKSKGWY